MAHSLDRVLKTIHNRDYGIASMEESVFKGLECSEFKIYHSHAKDEPNILHADQIPEIKHIKNKSTSSSLYRGFIGIHAMEVANQKK